MILLYSIITITDIIMFMIMFAMCCVQKEERCLVVLEHLMLNFDSKPTHEQERE